MESNVFIIGKISNTPQVVKNGEIIRIAFSVTESETGAVVPVIAETSGNFIERIKSGKTALITGTSFTRKTEVNGKIKCLRSLWAQGISVS